MKKIHLFTAILCLMGLNTQAQTAVLNVDAAREGVSISPTLYGLFYEEINHAGEGGLYAELIQNRSFEDAARPVRNRRFGANGEGERFGSMPAPGMIPAWYAVNSKGAASRMEITSENLLNEVQKKALCWTITEATADAHAAIANTGHWGISSVKGDTYTLNFWARADKCYKGNIYVGLQSREGGIWYAKTKVKGRISKKWKKYTATFAPDTDVEYTNFVIAADKPGTLYLDMVSLFPPTFKNRPNGCRKDLAEMLAALHPKFIRFPGGCFVEGVSKETAYEWKRTVGPLEERPGHYNGNWHYPVTDGMGYHEYLQLAEDLGAEPLYVVNVGIWHGGFVHHDSIDEYIQNALDAIEYANGDKSTKYGRMRIKNGHPKPFGMKYIEIGNENYQPNYREQSDHYAERYIQFYNAIKERYPEMQIIGNVESWGTDHPSWRNEHPVDLLDEHYYRSPSWFASKYNHYDSYDRNGPKIYVGEYAVTSDCGEGNLKAALGEAIYMMGMENNSDVVTMCSYAPVFVNIHDKTWMPDMIRFDAAHSWGSPSYYVQRLFAENVGTTMVASEVKQTSRPRPSKFSIGLGSWNTEVEYKDVKVCTLSETSETSEYAGFSDLNIKKGKWDVNDGIISQRTQTTECVAICPKAFNATSYDLTLKARKQAGDEGFLIIFDYYDEDNFKWLNLGGWGNTQHGIETTMAASKSTTKTAAGTIEAGRWYDIRIEVRNTKVRAFIDGQLVLDAEIGYPDMVYANAMIDKNTGELIVKVVNFDDADIPVLMNIKGGDINSAKATLLTADSGKAENTFTAPENVVPVATKTIIKDGYYTAPANSLTIWRMKTK
ncbi:MAG: carbohydrate binding domain-containing protein [Bacteroidaceae bacterium]|nr:carbohydrate binding domain-containing protein [Bacteroidaceae bacterium]